MAQKDVTGIILAGGVSSRMGKDKGLCEFKGRALVRFAIDALLPICDRIIISSNNIKGYESFGYKVVADKHRSIGPIGGIYSCLLESNTKHNLVLSCDTPNISTSLLRFILSNSFGYDVVVPEHGKSFIEPLAGYYSSGIIPNLEKSINNEEYKLMTFFNKVNFTSIRVDSISGYSNKLFKNLNTPDDLLSC